MLIDMHCHTKEGSMDAHVSIRYYAARLKKLGFDGMLVTDHNSYNGYRTYLKHKSDKAFKDFVVLKGIEYDTCDAGHYIIVMPENMILPIIEVRGLPVRLLIEIVHFFHGIIGPAHPFGEKYMSLGNTKFYGRHPEIMEKFDFLETYNSCIDPLSNKQVARLADKCLLPGTGGSDAHRLNCVGLGYTKLGRFVTKESELIELIREAHDEARAKSGSKSVPKNGSESEPLAAQAEKAPLLISGGTHYLYTARERLGRKYDYLLPCWGAFNKAASFIKNRKRKKEVASLLSVIYSISDTSFDNLFDDCLRYCHKKIREYQIVADQYINTIRFRR